MAHLMIFGAGYSGKAIAQAVRPTVERLSGTTRSAEKAAALRQAGLAPFLFDGERLAEPLRQALQDVTHLVQSIAPGQGGDPLLIASGGDLARLIPKLQWAAYLSTVGVYGDHGGAWVDEESPCRPVSARSKERIAAENAWRAACQTAGIPLAILRLSGIYGPGRNVFVNLEKGTARRLIKPGQVFNRIRVEDIGAATAFLSQHRTASILNVTDDEPCPPQDVVGFAAQLMGIEPPPEQPFETAELTPMARSFYGENKRVSNGKIRRLGFPFRFTDYRQSLRQLYTQGGWNA